MNLKEYRMKTGLRRAFVADTVGICGKHLNDIEGGRVNLTQKVAKKLSELYKLDIEKIFEMYEEGKMNNSKVLSEQAKLLAEIDLLAKKKNSTKA